jgi:hypothetical protein
MVGMKVETFNPSIEYNPKKLYIIGPMKASKRIKIKLLTSGGKGKMP